MIPEDYEYRIKNGDQLAEVLADRTPEDIDLVLDALMLWLERTQEIKPYAPPTAMLRSIEIKLPELAGDPRVLDAIVGEQKRRRARIHGPDSYFGPLLDDKKGRYELLERIGSGGQGTVYRAVDRKFRGSARSQVALKILAITSQHEAIRARGVDHPGVVHVHDEGLDESSGQQYIVYEYLEGKRLDAWIENRPLDPKMIAQLMLKLCDAVAAIHRSLIVHRDLKPGNIIVCGDRPVITDFGIAIQGRDDWMPAGTPMTLAPELRYGQGNTLIDIYGLGVVLHFLLSGLLPGPELKSLASDPGSIHSPRLWSIAMKCLEHQPSDRYQSTDKLARDLKAYIEHRPVSSHKESPITRAGLLIRRSPVPSILAILLIASLCWIFVSQRIEIESGKLDRTAMSEQLITEKSKAETSGHTTMITQRRLHQMILDMRLRDARLDPAMFWMIADLGDKGDWETWSYATLVSAEGVDLLRNEIARREADPNESRISLAYWWWLLARVETRTGITPEDQIHKAYHTARDYMIESLGPEDPLLKVLGEEIEAVGG